MAIKTVVNAVFSNLGAQFAIALVLVVGTFVLLGLHIEVPGWLSGLDIVAVSFFFRTAIAEGSR